MSQKRRFTPAQKVEILREYLDNDVPVSEICEKYEISPPQLSNWKKQLFEGALNTFQTRQKGQAKSDRKIQSLEKKLVERNSLISEVLAENIRLKKSLRGED